MRIFFDFWEMTLQLFRALRHSKGKPTWNSPIGFGVSFKSSWWARFHGRVKTYAYWVWYLSKIGELWFPMEVGSFMHCVLFAWIKCVIDALSTIAAKTSWKCIMQSIKIELKALKSTFGAKLKKPEILLLINSTNMHLENANQACLHLS